MISKRNGKIEILCFIFCVCVLLYHVNNDLWDGAKTLFDGVTFFSHGRTGVEFFFLVTGYLTAKSAKKIISSDNPIPIGQTTFDFVLKKVKSVFTPHIILCVLTCLLLIFNNKLTAEKFLNKLPSVFFLQATGLTDDYFIAVEWYLCAMFFAIAVVFPLLLKSFDFTSKVVAPVGSALLIGYMISKYDKLPSSLVPDSFLSPNNIRGLAVVLLGVFCFYISERIKSTDFSKKQKALLVAVENISWIISLYFMVSTINKRYEGIIVYVFALAVSLTFSRDFECKIYNNSFVNYLGRISLTVYLSQNLVRNFVKFNIDCSNTMYVILVVALTVITGVVIDFICNNLKKIKLKNNY